MMAMIASFNRDSFDMEGFDYASGDYCLRAFVINLGKTSPGAFLSYQLLA